MAKSQTWDQIRKAEARRAKKGKRGYSKADRRQNKGWAMKE
jgi:hypothetical protein